MSANECDVLLLSTQCAYPPSLLSELREAADQLGGKPIGSISGVMTRLVDKGMVYRPRRGEYRYTAPKFHDYLVRRASGTNELRPPAHQ